MKRKALTALAVVGMIAAGVAFWLSVIAILCIADANNITL